MGFVSNDNCVAVFSSFAVYSRNKHVYLFFDNLFRQIGLIPGISKLPRLVCSQPPSLAPTSQHQNLDYLQFHSEILFSSRMDHCPVSIPSAGTSSCQSGYPLHRDLRVAVSQVVLALQ